MNRQITLDQWLEIKEGYCKPCIKMKTLECRMAPCNEAQEVKCCAVCPYKCSGKCEYCK